MNEDLLPLIARLIELLTVSVMTAIRDQNITTLEALRAVLKTPAELEVLDRLLVEMQRAKNTTGLA